jgi:nucleoside-triphosphatase THEP1
MAGLLLGGARQGAPGLLTGLAAGLQMALRAVLALVGFTAASIELRNPRILEWLERRHFRGLSDALGLAFGALPAFTSALAAQSNGWRRPLRALGALLQMVDGVYAPAVNGRASIVILAGETGCGKTTKAGEVVETLRRQGLKVGGFLAPGVIAGGRKAGFNLVDLSSGETVQLCSENVGDEQAVQRWGRFEFRREGLAFGREALTANATNADVLVVDEVGPLELGGGGWAETLDLAVSSFAGPILLVVRHALVDAVKSRWGSTDTIVWDASRDAAGDIAGAVAESIALKRRPAQGAPA